MKHITAISRAPQRAQLAVDLGPIFRLVSDVLFIVAQALIAKENREFPSINIPGTGDL